MTPVDESLTIEIQGERHGKRGLELAGAVLSASRLGRANPADTLFYREGSNAKAEPEPRDIRWTKRGLCAQVLSPAQLAKRPIPQEATACHYQCTLGILCGNPRNVRDDEDRMPLAVEATQQLHHGALLPIIQASGRFVKNEELWAQCQDGRNGESLPLSFVQQKGVALPYLTEADCFQHLRDTCTYLCWRQAEVTEAKGHFLFNCGSKELVVGILKDIADLLCQVGKGYCTQLLAVEKNLPLRGGEKTAAMFRQCGFTRAVCAEESDKLPGGDCQGDLSDSW
jgi:hypothetical protein